MNLTPRQEEERQKYLKLLDRKRPYGTGFFGKNSIPLVEGWKPAQVLDLGAGRNLFCRALNDRGISATGVDWVFKADIEAPMWDVPLPNDYCDLITSFDALEHLLPEDVEPTVKEMVRLTKPGGRFLFSISYHPSAVKVNG